MDPAWVDALDLPLECERMRVDSCGLFLALGSAGGGVPLSLTLRVEGLRLLGTARRYPTPRAQEASAADDRAAQATLRRRKLEGTEVLLWDAPRADGLAARAARFAAGQAVFLLARTLRVELVDAAVGVRLPAAGEAGATAHPGSSRRPRGEALPVAGTALAGTGVLLQVGHLAVRPAPGAASYGVLRLGARLRDLGVAVLVQPGPGGEDGGGAGAGRGEGRRAPDAVPPTPGDAAGSTGDEGPGPARGAAPRRGRRDSRRDSSGTRPPGSPAGVRNPPAWAGHEAELHEWGRGLRRVPALSRWGFTGRLEWGLASAFYDAGSPVLDASLELNAVLLRLDLAAIATAMALAGAATEFLRFAAYRQVRPGVSVARAPQLWWSHAIRCVTRELQRSTFRYKTVAGTAGAQDMPDADAAGTDAASGRPPAAGLGARRRYVGAYLESRQLKTLWPLLVIPERARRLRAVLRELEQLESSLTLHDVVFFRWWAWALAPPKWQVFWNWVVGNVDENGAELKPRLWRTSDEISAQLQRLRALLSIDNAPAGPSQGASRLSLRGTCAKLSVTLDLAQGRGTPGAPAAEGSESIELALHSISGCVTVGPLEEGGPAAKATAPKEAAPGPGGVGSPATRLDLNVKALKGFHHTRGRAEGQVLGARGRPAQGRHEVLIVSPSAAKPREGQSAYSRERQSSMMRAAASKAARTLQAIAGMFSRHGMAAPPPVDTNAGDSRQGSGDFLSLSYVSDPLSISQTQSGKRLRVSMAPTDAFYRHEAAAATLALLKSLTLPPELDPSHVGALMTIRQAVEDRNAIASFRETHALALRGEVLNGATALHVTSGTLRMIFSAKSVDMLHADADTASTVDRPATARSDDRGTASDRATFGRLRHRLVVEINGLSLGSFLRDPVEKARAAQHRPSWWRAWTVQRRKGPRREREEPRPDSDEAAALDTSECSWMRKRPGAVQMVGQSIEFRLGVSLLDDTVSPSNEARRQAAGAVPAQIWILKRTDVHMTLHRCQEPVPTLSCFRAMSNLAVQCSDMTLAVSPFIEGYLRALAKDVGAEIVHATREAPAAGTGAPVQPGPGLLAGSPGAPSELGSVTGLQISMASVKIVLLDQDGDSQRGLCTLGLRRGAVSVALDVEETDVRLSLEQIMVLDHTGRDVAPETKPARLRRHSRRSRAASLADSMRDSATGTDGEGRGDDGTARSRPVFDRAGVNRADGIDFRQNVWNEYDAHVITAAPRRGKLHGEGLSLAMSDRGRLRMAFAAWRQVTAQACAPASQPGPTPAQREDESRRSSGLSAAGAPLGAAGPARPASRGWGRITNSPEHLVPLPTGQVFLSLSMPSAGRPHVALEMGYLGLRLDTEMPKRVLAAAVGFAESAKSIIESFGPAPGEALPPLDPAMPPETGGRGSWDSDDSSRSGGSDGAGGMPSAGAEVLLGAMQGWFLADKGAWFGEDAPVVLGREYGVGAEVSLSVSVVHVEMAAQGRPLGKLDLLDVTGQVEEIFTPQTEEAARALLAGQILSDPALVALVRQDLAAALRVDEAYLSDSLAPTGSPYVEVLQGTPDGPCGIDVASFNACMRRDWAATLLAHADARFLRGFSIPKFSPAGGWGPRTPTLSGALRVGAEGPEPRSPGPAGGPAPKPGGGLLTATSSPELLRGGPSPLRPQRTVGVGALDAFPGVRGRDASPSVGPLDGTPLSPLSPLRRHMRTGSGIPQSASPLGAPRPDAAPEPPPSANQYWSELAAAEARPVVRVSVSHVKCALVFRFLWDALLFGYDMGAAVGSAVERISAAIGGEEGGAGVGAEPGSPRAASLAGKAAAPELPAIVDVRARDVWVDMPRNSVSDQLFVFRTDHVRLALPACPDFVANERNRQRVEAVGSEWAFDPDGPGEWVSAADAWVSDAQMMFAKDARLDDEFRDEVGTHRRRRHGAAEAPARDPKTVLDAARALMEVSPDFFANFSRRPLSLPLTELLSRAADELLGQMLIQAGDLRVFQATFETNPMSGFSQLGPHHKLPWQQEGPVEPEGREQPPLGDPAESPVGGWVRQPLSRELDTDRRDAHGPDSDYESAEDDAGSDMEAKGAWSLVFGGPQSRASRDAEKGARGKDRLRAFKAARPNGAANGVSNDMNTAAPATSGTGNPSTARRGVRFAEDEVGRPEKARGEAEGGFSMRGSRGRSKQRPARDRGSRGQAGNRPHAPQGGGVDSPTRGALTQEDGQEGEGCMDNCEVGMPRMQWRYVGGGSGLVFAMEMGPTEAVQKWRIRICWPLMSMIFGEAQYDLLMGACMENLYESPTFSDESLGYPEEVRGFLWGVKIGDAHPFKPQPESVGVDESASPKAWDLAVEVGRIELLVESPPDVEPVTVATIRGHGKKRVALAKFAGARVNIHEYESGDRRVRVGSQGLSISDARWSATAMDKMSPMVLKVAPPQNASETRAARNWRRAMDLIKGQRPEGRRPEELILGDWPFLYDLTMQRCGTMAMEIRYDAPEFYWPYLANLDLVWDISEVSTKYWWQDYVSPFKPSLYPDQWMYVNVLMTKPVVRVPLHLRGVHRPEDEAPAESKDFLSITYDRLRVLYAQGGDNEATLRIDIQGLTGALETAVPSVEREAFGHLASITPVDYDPISPGAGNLIDPVKGFVEVGWHTPKNPIRDKDEEGRPGANLAMFRYSKTDLKLAISELHLRPTFSCAPYLMSLVSMLEDSVAAAPVAPAEPPAAASPSGHQGRQEVGDPHAVAGDLLDLASDLQKSRFERKLRNVESEVRSLAVKRVAERSRRLSLAPESLRGSDDGRTITKTQSVIGPDYLSGSLPGPGGPSLGLGEATPATALPASKRSTQHRLIDVADRVEEMIQEKREIEMALVNEAFMHQITNISVVVDNVAVVLVDDRDAIAEQDGHPIEVVRASVSKISCLMEQCTEPDPQPASVFLHSALTLNVKYLNSAIAEMEDMVEPWSLYAESRSVAGNTSLVLNSEDVLRLVTSPMCLRSIGDVMCFVDAASEAMAQSKTAIAEARELHAKKRKAAEVDLLDVGAASRKNAPKLTVTSSTLPRVGLQGDAISRKALAAFSSRRVQQRNETANTSRSAASRCGYALYKVRNETGCKLSVIWGERVGVAGRQVKRMNLAEGQEEAMTTEPAQTVVRMAESQLDIMARTVSLQLEFSHHQVHGVIVDKAGTFAYQLKTWSGVEGDKVLPLIVEVAVEHRVHKVVVRSQYSLHNETLLSLQFKLHMHMDAGGSKILYLPPGDAGVGQSGSLSAGGVAFVPLEQMHSCRIYVGIEGFEKSQKDVINLERGKEDLSDQQGLVTCYPSTAPVGSKEDGKTMTLQVFTTVITALSPDNALLRVPVHRLVFRPVVRLTNLLPAQASFVLSDSRDLRAGRHVGTARLDPGESMDYYNFNLQHKLVLDVSYGKAQGHTIAHQPIADRLGADRDLISIIEEKKRHFKREITKATPLELSHAEAGTQVRLGFSLLSKASHGGHWKDLTVIAPHWIINETGFDMQWRDKTATGGTVPGIAPRRVPRDPALPLGSSKGVVQLSLMHSASPWSKGLNLNQIGTKGYIAINSLWPLLWEADPRHPDRYLTQRTRTAAGSLSMSLEDHVNLAELAVGPGPMDEQVMRRAWTVYVQYREDIESHLQASMDVRRMRRGMPLWYLSMKSPAEVSQRKLGERLKDLVTRGDWGQKGGKEGGDEPEARAGKAGAIREKEKERGGGIRPRLEFAVDIKIGPAPFTDTRVLSLEPRFTLHNRCSQDIEIGQRGVIMQGAPVVCRIPAGASVPFHWPDGSAKRELIFRFAADDSNFSGSFAIDSAEDIAFRVPREGGDPPGTDSAEIVHAVIRRDRAAMSATFFSDMAPPYRIENRCRNTRLKFRQAVKGSHSDRESWHVLDHAAESGACVSEGYAWDMPLELRKIIVQVERPDFRNAAGQAEHEYRLDDIKVYPTITLHRKREGREVLGAELVERARAKLRSNKEVRDRDLTSTEQIYVACFADGATRVLAFSDSRELLNKIRNERNVLKAQAGRQKRLRENIELAQRTLKKKRALKDEHVEEVQTGVTTQSMVDARGIRRAGSLRALNAAHGSSTVSRRSPAPAPTASPDKSPPPTTEADNTAGNNPAAGSSGAMHSRQASGASDRQAATSGPSDTSQRRPSGLLNMFSSKARTQERGRVQSAYMNLGVTVEEEPAQTSDAAGHQAGDPERQPLNQTAPSLGLAMRGESERATSFVGSKSFVAPARSGVFVEDSESDAQREGVQRASSANSAAPGQVTQATSLFGEAAGRTLLPIDEEGAGSSPHGKSSASLLESRPGGEITSGEAEVAPSQPLPPAAPASMPQARSVNFSSGSPDRGRPGRSPAGRDGNSLKPGLLSTGSTQQSQQSARSAAVGAPSERSLAAVPTALSDAESDEFLGGELVIKVVKATDLEGKSGEFYAVLECQGQRRVTPGAKGSTDVSWNEEVAFPAVHVTADLKASIFQRPIIGPGQFLGEVIIPVRDVPPPQALAERVQEEDRAESAYTLARRATHQAVSGSLVLSMWWQVSDIEVLTLRNEVLEQQLDDLLEELAKVMDDDEAGRREAHDLLVTPPEASGTEGRLQHTDSVRAWGAGSERSVNTSLSPTDTSAAGAAEGAPAPRLTGETRMLRMVVNNRLRAGRGSGMPRGAGAVSSPGSAAPSARLGSDDAPRSPAHGGVQQRQRSPLETAAEELGVRSNKARPMALSSTPGKLEVGILQARNLSGLSKSSLVLSQDTYCKMFMRSGIGGVGVQSSQTRVVKNAATPAFGESFEFEPAQLNDVLEFTVIRKRLGRSDKELGSVKIQLWALEDSMPRYAWLPLTAKVKVKAPGGGSVLKTVETGELHVRLRWRDDNEASAGSLNVEVGLKGIGVLLVDSGLSNMNTRMPSELLYASVTGIELNVRRNAENEYIHAAVRSLQVDNQLLSSRHPVILGRSIERSALQVGSPTDDPDAPFIDMRALRSFSQPGLALFNNLTLGVSPMALVVEEEFIDALMSLVSRINYDDLYQPKYEHARDHRVLKTRAKGRRSRAKQGVVTNTAVAGLLAMLEKTSVDYKTAAQGSQKQQMFYFEKLTILPIRLTVTVLPYPAGGGDDAGLNYLSNPDLGSAMKFFRVMGINMLDITDIDIEIKTLHFENAFVDERQLVKDIVSHYTNQAVHQMYKILGAVDILAPVNFVAKTSYGVVSTVASALVLAGREGNVKDFSLALTVGTGTVIKTTVGGVFATSGKVVDIFSKGFSRLALDDQYMLRSRRKPTSIVSGLALGTQDLMSGIVDGLAGLVKAPIAGAEKKGVKGFAKGVVTGVMGVAFKPVTGVLEFTSKTVAGMAASVQHIGPKRGGLAGDTHEMARVKAPSAGLGGAAGLRGNVELCQRWTAVIKRLRQGRYADERVVDFLQNKPNKAVLLTNVRVVYLNLKKRVVRWTARYSQILKVDLFGLSLVLQCKVRYRRLHLTMPRKRMLKCQTRELQHALLSKLSPLLENNDDVPGESASAEVSRVESDDDDDAAIPDDVDLSIMLKPHAGMLLLEAPPSRVAPGSPPPLPSIAEERVPVLPEPWAALSLVDASPVTFVPPTAGALNDSTFAGGGAGASEGGSADKRRLKDKLKGLFKRGKKDAGRDAGSDPGAGPPRRAAVPPPLAQRGVDTASGTSPPPRRALDFDTDSLVGPGPGQGKSRLAGLPAGARSPAWPQDAPEAVRAWETRAGEERAEHRGLGELRAVVDGIGGLVAGLTGACSPQEAEAVAGSVQAMAHMALELCDGEELRPHAGARSARQLLAQISTWAGRLEASAVSPGGVVATIEALCGAARRVLS